MTLIGSGFAGGEEGGVGAVGERASRMKRTSLDSKLAGDAPGEELDEVVVGARGEGLAVRGHREDVHGVLMVVREALLHVRGLGVAHVHRPVRTARHQASLVAGADETHVAGARDVAEVRPAAPSWTDALNEADVRRTRVRPFKVDAAGAGRMWLAIRSDAPFLKV